MYETERAEEQTNNTEWNNLSKELDNIRNHIKLTKEHIDALNIRFAGYQNPPGIYLSEYDEWTQKLHRFITREQSIRERLTDLAGPHLRELGGPVQGGPG